MRIVSLIVPPFCRLRLFIVATLCMASTMVLYGFFITRDLALAKQDPLFSMSISDDKKLQDLQIWPGSTEDSSAIGRTIKQLRSFEDYAQRYNASVRKSKTILLLGEFFFDFGKAQRAFVDDRCPISECTLTLDADKYRQTVDAIFILNMDAKTLNRFLPKPAHQIWIANHWESPLNNGIDTVTMGPYINWSSSYRHDSHIVTPYGYIERLPESSINRDEKPINYAAGKTKQVAWFASNCAAKNGRQNYTYELTRYINVDIYGKCGLGKLECSKTNESQCFEWLKKDYKFYLAFENSNCHYYMTEKLFVNALGNNVIPIVMGARRQDYAEALPPHSFIHVDDFRSPRDLADYLHVLDSNDTLYNEYFRWKTEFKLTVYSYWCRLCGLLHVASEQRYVHWYTDYSQWWDGNHGSSCGSKWTNHDGVSWQTWNIQKK